MARRGDPYAGIPGRRIFVAAPVAPDVREAIESLVNAIRAAADPGRREVRWIRLDGLHVTLRFIGPTLEARIPAALEAMQAAAREASPFDVAIDGAGAFPNHDRPRALWLGLGLGVASLTDLTASLDRELAERGWPADPRPFRPHLTLARSDGIASGSQTVERLIEAAQTLQARWTVDRVVLFESVTGGGPARYVPLGEAALGEG